MKNKIILPGICLLLLLLGCSKEFQKEEISNTVKSPKSDVITGTECADDIEMVCGNMLYFTDMNHFQDVYACLEVECEQWNDAFDLQYSSLNDDDLNDLIDSIGWDEEQPLANFESVYSPNFTSHRAYLRNLEQTWLNNGMDTTNGPTEYDVLDDEILRTLFNSALSVRIGGTIYHYDSEGNLWEILNADCDLITLINTDPDSASHLPGKIKLTPFLDPRGSSTASCKEDWKPDRIFKTYNGDTKRVKLKISYTNRAFSFHGIDVVVAKGKMVHYKKKNGNWKTERKNLQVTIDGQARDTCEAVPYPFDGNKGPKKRKRLKCIVPPWNQQSGNPEYIQSGDFKVLFKVSSSYSYLWTATW